MESLIIYSSTDGHTKIICEKIKNNLENVNNITLISLRETINLDLSKFNQIIIGASIRYGKHSSDLYRFIRSNKKTLEQTQLNLDCRDFAELRLIDEFDYSHNKESFL